MQPKKFALAIAAFSLLSLWAAGASAQPSQEVCRSSGGPSLCVRFDNLAGAPQENTDFTLSFDGNGIPSVNLLRGEDAQETLYEWRVWSKDAQEAPANINAITAVGAYDYDVKIRNAAGSAGAATVGDVDLDPSDNAKFSRITSGRITGDLTGDLLVQKSSGGSGGTAALRIDGDVTDTATLTIPTIDVGEEVYVVGHMEGIIDMETLKGTLRVDDDLTGTIIISDGMEGGFLNLLYGICLGGVVRVADMDTRSSVDSEIHVGYYWDPDYDLAGSLLLLSGIPENQYVKVFGHLASDGQINLYNAGVAGTLDIDFGGDGDIINGGALTGRVKISKASNADPFSGDAYFASVSGSGGYYGLTVGDMNGLTGTINVSGNVTGDIKITGGNDLGNGGEINVGGDVSGLISIDGSASGSVEVTGDSSGRIEVGDDLTSSGLLSVGGALGATAVIEVQALCDGDIKVGDGMAVSGQDESLILVRNLGENGSITVNDSAGAVDIDGIIHVGMIDDIPVPLPDVTFDGSIIVKDDTGATGATFNGEIGVVGCHATPADLDICICATDNGTVTIQQFNCKPYQVVEDCETGCP